MGHSAAIAQLLAAKPPRVGPFRILAELGQGGFAPVFLAAEEYGGVEVRTVALKLFALEDLESFASHAKIVDEARALCHVEHPNVVRFLQIIEAPRGVLGLAMEHVRGRSLDDRLDGKSTLPMATVLDVGVAVASALAAVHAVGLVHRDVKPGNVIDAGGVYKLIDFGIATRTRAATLRPALPPAVAASEGGVPVVVHPEARVDALGLLASDTDASERTIRASENHDGERDGTDAIAGTMGYIDPVCLARGEPATASSDLYALGAMLYECITGRLPASTPDAESVLRVRMNVVFGFDPPDAVHTLAPATPEGLARLVDSLIAPEREHRPQRAEWVACELDRLRRLEQGAARTLPEEGPFRGLEVFEDRHRDIYFGRASDVASAVELLRSRGVVALVGPSGSGKSSLARAGVLPAVAFGALGAWPARFRSVIVSPGNAPRASLARALAPLLGEEALPDEPDALHATLSALVERTDTGIVILVDALEEMITIAQPEDRTYVGQFLAALATRPVPGLRAVVTARRDLLDPLLADPALGIALTRAVQLVAPLTAPAWLDVVEDRLAAYGYALEDEVLRSELGRELKAVAEAMPLVEFALARLWELRDESRHILPRAALTAIGGLAGALARHAEATLAAVVNDHGPRAQGVAAALLLALTTPHGTRATRTRDELARELGDPLQRVVLAAFERARLVVVDEERVTLAHDALITRWPRLRAWAEAVRREREIARDVEEATSRWLARPERELLLRGSPLREARALAAGSRARLSKEAQAFVRASRRDDLRSRAGVVTFVCVVLLGLGAVGVAYRHETAAADRRADADKQEALKVFKSLTHVRDQSAEERAREIEALVMSEHACRRDLARCSGLPERDAGPLPR